MYVWHRERLVPNNWSLAILGFVGSAGWWYGYSLLLQGRALLDEAVVSLVIVYAIVSLLALSLWLGSLFFMQLLPAGKFDRWGGLVASLLPMVVIFWIDVWGLAAIMLVALAIWWGMRTIQHRLLTVYKIQPFAIISSTLGLTMLLLIAAMSLLYYRQLVANATTTTEGYGQHLVSRTVNITEQFLPSFFSQYQPDLPLDDFLGQQIPRAEKLLADIQFSSLEDEAERQELIRQRLEATGVDVEEIRFDAKASREQLIASLDPQLQSFRRRLVADSRQELSKRLRVPLDGRESMHQVVVKVLDHQYETYVQQYVQYIPPLLALALFFVLRLFSGPLILTIAGGSWLLYRGLLRFGGLQRTTRTVKAEQLTWIHTAR